ncbi:Plasma membrane proteolipid 3 like protein [Verticillium longisporum]|uniref:Stress response RCI peptide n=3 Tax=Verticillium TaxID=1036719 RepID=G2XCV6_VERDV|nr:uncharacterized protein VDAG_07988 [Verticillium dahliae VdLs.17]KAF3345584.1 Dolichyl-diphosphooligosaccharide--protein glycosyltransferase subunit 1 [Verticillium dahliae VDG2]KAF3355093.1 hypothetical protein VdG1_04305 [Verticillium dahliae VDG1]KAG7133565.1 Plasma membrane proteolipid 3 like protein [Verticillium longisporum]KAH6706804.1 hypothetical protein EV126DRAFT_149145 [Verticillium dahliae]EGY16824.1 hypothetical protein VDAG_07988 [Verticillium dahliae VdLs.17]
MCSADIFLGFLAVLFPPLPVWVKRGICSADSIINILLCVLGFIPGLIHAWYIIVQYPEPASEYDSLPQHDREGGRVTYVFVHGDGRQPQQQARPHKGQPQPQQNHNNLSYGTAGNSSQQQQHGNGGEGSSDGAAPPSYAAVVAQGDNKVQTHD